VGADGMAHVRIDKRASTPSNAGARSIQLVTRSAGRTRGVRYLA